MSAASIYYQITRLGPHDVSTRAVQANIYQNYTNDGENNILLATATITSTPEKHTDFTFPGSAWTDVYAVERLPSDLEFRYLQLMQQNLFDWKIRVPQENARTLLTPEQDHQISNQLNIAPGSVNLAPFVLKPIH